MHQWEASWVMGCPTARPACMMVLAEAVPHGGIDGCAIGVLPPLLRLPRGESFSPAIRRISDSCGMSLPPMRQPIQQRPWTNMSRVSCAVDVYCQLHWQALVPFLRRVMIPHR